VKPLSKTGTFASSRDLKKKTKKSDSGKVRPEGQPGSWESNWANGGNGRGGGNDKILLALDGLGKAHIVKGETGGLKVVAEQALANTGGQDLRGKEQRASGWNWGGRGDQGGQSIGLRVVSYLARDKIKDVQRKEKANGVQEQGLVQKRSPAGSMKGRNQLRRTGTSEWVHSVTREQEPGTDKPTNW